MVIGLLFSYLRLHAMSIYTASPTHLQELLGVQGPRGIDPNLWVYRLVYLATDIACC